jgi:hypothetical protein
MGDLGLHEDIMWSKGSKSVKRVFGAIIWSAKGRVMCNLHGSHDKRSVMCCRYWEFTPCVGWNVAGITISRKFQWSPWFYSASSISKQICLVSARSRGGSNRILIGYLWICVITVKFAWTKAPLISLSFHWDKSVIRL